MTTTGMQVLARLISEAEFIEEDDGWLWLYSYPFTWEEK